MKNNICKHNNTVPNGCSDCNEEELFDDILDFTLTEIYNLLIGSHNTIVDIIDDYQEHKSMINDEMKNKVEQEILRRLRK